MSDVNENAGNHNPSQELASSQESRMKQCPYCKADIEASSKYCEYCGSKIDDARDSSVHVSTVDTQVSKSIAPMGTWALVCSIVGLVVFLGLIFGPESSSDDDPLYDFVVFLGLASSIVGMVLGIVGMTRIRGKHSAYSNTSILKAGMILGIIGVAFWVVTVMIGFLWILLEEGVEGLLN